VDDLEPLPPRLHAVGAGLVGGQEARVDELGHDLFRHRAVGDRRQQLFAVERRASPLRGREVPERLARDTLAGRPDAAQGLLGMPREGSGHTSDVLVGPTGQQLLLAIATVPDPRHCEGQQRQRAPRAFHGTQHLVHERVVLEAEAAGRSRLHDSPAHPVPVERPQRRKLREDESQGRMLLAPHPEVVAQGKDHVHAAGVRESSDERCEMGLRLAVVQGEEFFELVEDEEYFLVLLTPVDDHVEGGFRLLEAGQLRQRLAISRQHRAHTLRAAAGVRSWTVKHLLWVKTLRFEHAAQEAAFLDYLHEVEHAAERVARLEAAIDRAIEAASAEMRAVIAGLQALHGIKKVSAVSIVAEVGPLSRFSRPQQLMGYSGMVSSEDSTGSSVRRGAITKTGKAHLRRIVGEAAWAYQYRPSMSPILRQRQEGLSEEAQSARSQHVSGGRAGLDRSSTTSW
jgi:Transposase IS116/IS110/IS902 family